jgi:cytosine permease
MENISAEKVSGAHVESNALRRIPENQRQRWTSIAFIWIGTMICIPMLMVGGLLAGAMTLGNIVIAAALGFLICSLIMVLGGMQATDLGLPSSMCATKAFGDRGSSYITSLVIFIAQLGWFGVQTATCATAFVGLMNIVGVRFPFWIACVIWGVVMLISAVYGFKFMKILNYIAVPALAIMCIYGIVHVTGEKGWDAIASFVPAPEATMTMPAAVSLVIGLFAVGTVINADFTRYAKSRTSTFLATVVGVLPAAVFMIFTGAVMARGADNYDITIMFANVGVPFLGMLVLILATWTTNTTNAYTAGLAAMKVLSLKDTRRPLVTSICGIIGIIIAIAGLADVLTGFVTVLGALVPPVAGVFVADYWIVGRGKAENWHPVKGFNWCGIAAWAIGSIVALFFSFFSPALDGIIVCAIVYVILYTLLGKTVLGGQGTISLEEVEEKLK